MFIYFPVYFLKISAHNLMLLYDKTLFNLFELLYKKGTKSKLSGTRQFKNESILFEVER